MLSPCSQGWLQSGHGRSSSCCMIRHPQNLREEEKRVHNECLQSGRLLPFFSSLSERDSDQKVPIIEKLYE